MIDAKHHIYTYETDGWSLKGRFAVAEDEDEDIAWSQNENGEHIAHLLAVSDFFNLKYLIL
jgi:hypothetical protein